MADQSWLQSLGLAPSLAALAALAPPIGAVWAVWKWGVDRADKRNQEARTYDQRRTESLDALQAGLRTEQAAMVAGLRTENRDQREEMQKVEYDRNRGWDLARYWYGQAHEMWRRFTDARHELVNARQYIIAFLKRHPEEVAPEFMAEPATGPIPMPLGIEDPIPRREP